MKLNDKNKARIRLGYGIALSVILAVVGILFICSCYSIYKSGSSPFTRESIGAAFSKIALPTYFAIATVIGGGIVAILIPDEKQKLVGIRSARVVLKKLADKVDTEQLDEELASKIVKERSLRSILDKINVAIIAIAAIAPLFYLMNPHNFPAVSGEYNAEILHGMLVYLAFLLPVAVYEVVYVILCDRSCNREIELCKVAIKAVGTAPKSEGETECPLCRLVGCLKKNEKQIVLGVRIALVGCAIVFIIAGIANGGMIDVLNKAIKICTECIGLG